jgi:hypothetical protein
MPRYRYYESLASSGIISSIDEQFFATLGWWPTGSEI